MHKMVPRIKYCKRHTHNLYLSDFNQHVVIFIGNPGGSNLINYQVLSNLVKPINFKFVLIGYTFSCILMSFFWETNLLRSELDEQYPEIPAFSNPTVDLF